MPHESRCNRFIFVTFSSSCFWHRLRARLRLQRFASIGDARTACHRQAGRGNRRVGWFLSGVPVLLAIRPAQAACVFALARFMAVSSIMSS